MIPSLIKKSIKICVVLCLLGHVIWAQNVPKIILLSPQDNLVTTKDKILFKGKVENTSQLYLNNESIDIELEGKFYHKMPLTKPDSYHFFNVLAISPDGTKTELKVKVFYKKSIIKVNPDNSVANPKPLINLLAPPNNMITEKKKVLFKGQVLGATDLSLNGVTINVNNKGEFYHRELLTKENDYQIFVLEALSQDKKSSTKIMRQVFYQTSGDNRANIVVDDPSDKFVSSEQDITFSGKVINGVSLTINDDVVTLDEQGQFEYQGYLDIKNDYNLFILKAENSFGDITTIERKIYFQGIEADKKRELSYSDVKEEDINFRIPSIVVKSPQNNFVTYKNHMRIEGITTHTKELFINNRLAILNEKGEFSESFELDNIGKYVFNMYALGENELNTTSLLKVFRVSEESGFSKDTDAIINPLEQDSVSSKLSRQISLDLAGADIRDVLEILSKKGDLNIVTDKSLEGEVYISLDKVSILDAIDFILGSQGISYKFAGNTILVGSKTFLDQPARLETKIIRLNNMYPKNLVPILNKYLSGDETIQFNDKTLILNMDSRKLDKLSALIKKLDAEKVPQIILEAQILEISKSMLDNLGVSWTDTYGVGAQANFSPDGLTYAGAVSLQTVISLLESEGKARVLAKPRIKAIHGETASIYIGDKIPYTTLTVGTTGTIAEAVQFVNSGIQLSILPEVNVYNREIKIKIQPEVSYVNGYRGPNNDIPIVRTRRVDTTVFVKDGNTVLIGGLFNSSDTDNQSRLPFLGRIPFIGKLFSSKKQEQDQTELVIAITPKIINDDFQESIPLPLVK